MECSAGALALRRWPADSDLVLRCVVSGKRVLGGIVLADLGRGPEVPWYAETLEGELVERAVPGLTAPTPRIALEATMRFRLRRSIKLGPFRVHFTDRGYSSWSVKLGRFSWNSRTRRKRFDTPGPGHVEW